MTAYGVASRAMFSSQYNLLTFDGRSIFRQLIYPTYYLMYGNVGVELEQLDGKLKRKKNFFSFSHFIFFSNKFSSSR